jgi:TolB protein
VVGSLKVDVVTTGIIPAPFRAFVGSQSQAVPPNGSVTFSGLTAGSHTVELTELPSTCTVFTNPRTVSVSTKGATSTLFEVACAEGTVSAGTIVFASFVDPNNSEIFAMHSDGSGLRRLTNSPGSDMWPALSPDGSKIAFVSHREGNGDLYVMNSDGTNEISLAPSDSADLLPVWSPDGQRIAFTSYRDERSEVYLVNADGTGLLRLTHTPGSDHALSWSPDGNWIVFLSRRSGNNDLWLMRSSDGSVVRQLTTYAGGDDEADWSPDGSQIAFVRGLQVWTLDIHMDTEGIPLAGLERQVTALGSYSHGPNWSPDGNRIAIHTNHLAPRVKGSTNPAIWSVRPDGSDPLKLTVGTNGDREPSWGIDP